MIARPEVPLALACYCYCLNSTVLGLELCRRQHTAFRLRFFFAFKPLVVTEGPLLPAIVYDKGLRGSNTAIGKWSEVRAFPTVCDAARQPEGIGSRPTVRLAVFVGGGRQQQRRAGQ